MGRGGRGRGGDWGWAGAGFEFLFPENSIPSPPPPSEAARGECLSSDPLPAGPPSKASARGRRAWLRDSGRERGSRRGDPPRPPGAEPLADTGIPGPLLSPPTIAAEAGLRGPTKSSIMSHPSWLPPKNTGESLGHVPARMETTHSFGTPSISVSMQQPPKKFAPVVAPKPKYNPYKAPGGEGKKQSLYLASLKGGSAGLCDAMADNRSFVWHWATMIGTLSWASAGLVFPFLPLVSVYNLVHL
uniref:Uncharacterized protein n=1 Tax=Monodelphis domestica TaxID=13616 RepID=A0A5F8H9Z3_MONDO